MRLKRSLHGSKNIARTGDKLLKLQFHEAGHVQLESAPYVLKNESLI